MNRLAACLLFASLTLAACAPKESAEKVEADPAASSDASDTAARSAPVPADGHFRSGTPIRLPVPIVREPSAGPISQASQALRADTVEQAVVASMGEAAVGIDITVQNGIVMLAGEVATEADFQRAHYVARALPGVIEVDQSQMRVAR